MVDKKNQSADQAAVVPSSIRVLMPNGHILAMKLETYLAGVVAMEIDSNAPLEALKAQAVASRTYAAAASRHLEKNADVCTKTHCQKWKRVDPIVAPEVFRAVSETWGVVAMHEGKLIEAFFFEHCSGQTRNSEDMAMPEFPYLRGVNCPCGFSDMRGHGVGLCQRGAIVLARNGASFEQILRHYYRGIAIVHTQREEQPLREQPEVRKGKEPRTKTSAPLEKPNQPKRAPVPSPPAQPAPESHEITTLIKILRRTQAAVSTLSAKKESVPEKPAQQPVTPEPIKDVSSEAPARDRESSRASSNSNAFQHPPGTSARGALEQQDSNRPRVDVSPRDDLPDGFLAELEPKVFHADAPSMAPAVPDGAGQETLAQPGVSVPELLRVCTRISVDNLPGPRMIAGCLASAGVVVNIEDMHGNKAAVVSGSAPHYGEGGFETIVDEDGYYAVSIEAQLIEVNVRGDTVFIRADSIDNG